MAFYDEESLESLPLRLFLAFFSLAGVAKGIYGLRETHYSGIVKMVDVVVSFAQRGFIRGRSMVRSIFEIDAC